MKKTRLFAAFLATIMAFSAVPAITVNAEEEVLAETIEIVSVPDDIYNADIDEILDDVVINVTYSDDSTKEMTLSNKNTEIMMSVDYSEAYGYAGASFFIGGMEAPIAIAYAQMFVSDYVEFEFVCDFENFEPANIESKFEYPESFELPDAFAKDGNSYNINDDGTLTLVGNLDSITNEKSYDGMDIEIPSTVYGKTVTIIEEGAFANFSKPSSVTIPETVTQIGDHAFGYFLEEEEDMDSLILFSACLQEKLIDTKDDDILPVYIQLYGDDCDSYCEYIMSTYFSEDVEYDYDSEYAIIYLNAKKSDLLAISEDEDLYIGYSGNFKSYVLDDYLLSAFVEASDDDLFDVCIELYDEEDLDAQCEYIISTYFDNTEDYFYDYEYGTIYMSATKAQLLSISNDEYVYIFDDSQIEDSSYMFSDALYEYITNPENAGKKIEVAIEVYTEDVEAVAEFLTEEYFGGTEDYVIDEWHRIIITATPEQLLSIDVDDYFIYAVTPESIDQNLYFALLDSADDATFDIMGFYDRPSILHPSIEKVINNCFGDLEYITFEALDQEIFVVENVTKEQLNAIANKPVKGLSLSIVEDPELTKIDDFIVYGTKGTVAEDYAIANGFRFVDVNEEFQLGDINLDGKVSIQDTTLLQRYVADVVTLNEYQLAYADFDGNGIVNINDATAIQRKLVSE